MTNTRRLVSVATLAALSFVLMLFNFPIIPGVDFLKLDFSLIPILLGLVIFDLKFAYMVLLLRSLLKLLLDNGGAGGIIGLPMNIVALGFFVTSFAILWKKKQNLLNFIKASLVGTVLITVSMMLLNYIYAMPLYASFAHFDIAKILGVNQYLFGMVLPFNLLQGLILSVTFYIVYQSMKSLLERF